jgi:hypothetical protein
VEEVISHYKAGGRSIKKKEFAGVGSENPLKIWFQALSSLSKNSATC